MIQQFRWPDPRWIRVADAWGSPLMSMLNWNILLHSCLDLVSQILRYNKVRILGSIELQLPSDWTDGRITTKDALHFCSRTRSVMKDLDMFHSTLEQKDKKSIIQRTSPTIRDLQISATRIQRGSGHLNCWIISSGSYISSQ